MEAKNYEVFKIDVTNKVTELLREQGIDVESHVVKKNNNHELDGLVIKYPGKNVSPTIYLNHYYDRYLNGEINQDEIIENILEIVNEQSKEVEGMNFDSIFQQEYVKKNLYAVVVNYENNKNLLKDVPHKEIEDLSIVPRLRVAELEGASCIVTNEMVGRMGFTQEEILELAIKNNENQIYNLKSMDTVMKEILIDQGADPEVISEMIGESETPMFVLTNSEKLNGASCLACKNTMSKAADEIGEDFYILPSSIHEILIVPVSKFEDPEQLYQMVLEVNATQVSEEDRLSDSVYIYKAKEQKIEQIYGKEIDLKTNLEKDPEIIKSKGRK